MEMILSSSSDEEDTDNSDDDTVSCKAGPTQEKRQRGRKVVITLQLAATLDRTKMSDRKAMFIISETAKSLGHNITNLALNRNSIRRLRMKHQSVQSAALKAKFQGNVPLVVHWDGKLIAGLTSKEQVDRLLVIVLGKGVSQLLAVAKLTSGTGEAQASAVYSAIEDWGITENIRAMCFDTTSSNAGRMAGACVLLVRIFCPLHAGITSWSCSSVLCFKFVLDQHLLLEFQYSLVFNGTGCLLINPGLKQECQAMPYLRQFKISRTVPLSLLMVILEKVN